MELQLLLLIVISLIIICKYTALLTVNNVIAYFLNAATQNDHHVQYSLHDCFWNHSPIFVLKPKRE